MRASKWTVTFVCGGLLGGAMALGGPGWAGAADAADAAVAPAEPAAEGSVDRAELTVPDPDLSAMQPASRRKVEMMRQSVEKLLAAEDTDPAELARSFGFLGQLLHAFEKLDAAAASYANARRLDPTDARWPYYLGLIGRAKGDFRPAIEDFRAALELTPDDNAALLRLADALIELGQLEEAQIYLERLEQRTAISDAADAAGGADGTDLPPETAAGLYGQGRIADLRGDHATAARLFERVIRLQPAAGSAHYALGQAYRGLGEADKATHHLELGDETPVAFPDPHVAVLSSIAASSALGVVADLAADEEEFSAENFLGFVLSQIGRIPSAVNQMKEMLGELDRTGRATPLQRARLEYAIGALLVRQGEDEASIEHFERAVAGDPGLIDARAKLGNALVRTGRLAEAFESFDRAVAADPADPDLLAKRATVLVNLERLAEARADLDRLVEMAPTHADGWRLLASLREREGDVDGAVDAMRRAAELGNDPEVKMERFTDLGAIYYRQRRYESAARSYLEALRIDQTFVPALSRLAALLGQLKELDRSAEVYARWIAVEPANPAPRVGEATALILSGSFAAARDRLEAGLEALPGNLDLMDILARHLAACPDPAIRDGARAVELALPVYQRVPTLESAETLAMAYAEARNFDEAVSIQQRLLGSAGEETREEVIATWQANLALYQSGRPCCAPRAH